MPKFRLLSEPEADRARKSETSELADANTWSCGHCGEHLDNWQPRIDVEAHVGGLQEVLRELGTNPPGPGPVPRGAGAGQGRGAGRAQRRRRLLDDDEEGDEDADEGDGDEDDGMDGVEHGSAHDDAQTESRGPAQVFKTSLDGKKQIYDAQSRQQKFVGLMLTF